MSDQTTNGGRPQFSVRQVLVAVAVCALAFTGIRCVTHYVPETIDDAYAMWAAGDLLLDYMEDYDGKWPRSWEELADHHERSGEGETMFGPVSAVQARINIDFTFDPVTALDSIERTDTVPDFRVVNTKTGRDAYWSEQEPNQRIFDWLKSRKFPAAAPD